ncbi:MAG: ABC transporter ATP-binding protein [Luteibaculaceae bacterium]
MISVNELKKVYGDHVALYIEELNIKPGTNLGVVGNNGAGKTTFLSLLLDLIEPTHGKIEIDGDNVKSENWKPFTGAFLDESFLIGYLRPEEYFKLVADLKGFSKEALEEFLQPFVNLFNDEILGKKKFIRDLSKGNQKKVGITAALIGNPKLVVLDEPFANLDPTTAIRLRGLLKSMSKGLGVTMIISSHDLNHVTEVADRIIIIEKGRVIKDIETTENTLKELEAWFNPDLELSEKAQDSLNNSELP